MRTIRAWMGLAIAALALAPAGCREQETPETATEHRQLIEELGSLKAQLHSVQAEKERLEKKIQDLQKNIETLQGELADQTALATRREKEIERLRVGGVAAVKAVEEALKAEAEAAAARAAVEKNTPGPDQPRQEREQRIAEIAKDIAALEPRITNLRAQIARGQAEVSSLIKATIDVRTPVPPGAYISNGHIYVKKLTCNRVETGSSTYPWGGHRHSDACYEIYHIGPEVKKGDYRTQRDKDAAIEAAKKGLIPLFDEVRSLSQELAQRKEELGSLRREEIGAAAEVTEDVLTTLRHKETGETIQGALTDQKVNNLTVFKLEQGGTKFINLDEWEPVETKN